MSEQSRKPCAIHDENPRFEYVGLVELPDGTKCTCNRNPLGLRRDAVGNGKPVVGSRYNTGMHAMMIALAAV